MAIITHTTQPPTRRALYQSKRLYVATEKGVLAALNARTGDVEWRHLTTKQRGDVEQTDVLVLAKQCVLTLSAGGKYVRKWQAADGTLVWDSVTFGAEGEGVGAGVDMAMSDSGRHVVVLSHDTVYFYDATSGVLEWTQTSYVGNPPATPPTTTHYPQTHRPTPTTHRPRPTAYPPPTTYPPPPPPGTTF